MNFLFTVTDAEMDLKPDHATVNFNIIYITLLLTLHHGHRVLHPGTKDIGSKHSG